MSAAARDWRLRALTPIWTGGIEGKGDRLVPSGLLGSIRWWFEVLVRGLGGAACDPSDTQGRCPDKKGRHCVVCELFGCTGWARKFRLQVLDEAGKPKAAPIQKDETFTLCFVPLRPIQPEEWALINLTLRLIAEYGALGGKTIYKPTDEKNRESEQHHQDYGLVKIEKGPDLTGVGRARLSEYVARGEWLKAKLDLPWASLANFWCVNGRHLSRSGPQASTFNKVLGRKEDKSVKEKNGKRVVRWSDLLDVKGNGIASWLSGRQQESKKVFSFKAVPRTFGFVKPGTIDFNGMKERLKRAWADLKDEEFLAGVEVLNGLLGTSPGAE
jgi:CRISPR-associated protein Cmr1